MLTWTRRLIAIAAALAAIPAVAGCTVPLAGMTGISVTADGQALGVIQMCHDHIDGVSLYPDDDPQPAATTGRWHRDAALTGFSTWPLTTDGADEGWSVEQRLGTLDPKQTYRLYSWTDDSSWSTVPVTVTSADLEELAPGQVRYEIDDKPSTSSVEDFRTTACEHF
ncbi:hypothetical protein ACFY8W_30750 [Streptomyces sp. NPDC012637]|uniref:hypothetical protein n=1 Tax=Streptomyces sp. NPDC012637 TaxID=3364842 RepID=UPI0036E4DA9F